MKAYEIKAVERYIKQALIDLEIADKDDKKVIAANIEDKMRKFKDVLSVEDMERILKLFTQSVQAKKRITERHASRNIKNSLEINFNFKMVKSGYRAYRMVTSLNWTNEAPLKDGGTIIEKSIVSQTRAVIQF